MSDRQDPLSPPTPHLGAVTPAVSLNAPGVRVADADGSGRMFDQIARKYDLLNRVISLGLDQRWRRQLIDLMPRDGELLDVATGTADVALSIVKTHPQVRVVGLDPSVGMLAVGREKVARRGLEGRVSLDEGDALEMPYEDGRFSGSCVAFGVRNFPDRLRGLREMSRVTRAGGPVAVLELSEPRGGLFAPFARLHVHHVVPWLGALLSGNSEYRYLQRSVAAFPPPSEFKALMEEAGLTEVRFWRMPFGVAHLYVGRAAGRVVGSARADEPSRRDAP